MIINMEDIEDNELPINKIVHGNALSVLRKLPSNSIDCVITSPPYWCLAEGHEILTYDGWKDVSEIKVGDLVLSANPETMELEWVKVIAIGKWLYKGKMIYFKGKGIDLLVTPNHRMFVYYRKIGNPIKEKQKDSKGRWTKSKLIGYFVKAKDIKVGYITPKIGWRWKGKDEEYFTLPELNTTYNHQKVYYPPKKIKMENWLAFFGLWIAEGSVRGSKGGKRKSYEITIKQKEPKASKIRALLNKLPFKYNEYKNKDIVVFSIVDQQLYNYLKQFGNSHTKYIPREIKELSPRLLSVLLKWYLFGDGTIKHGKYVDIYCYSSSRKLKDDLIEIALKVGINASIEGDGCTLHFVKRKTVKLKDAMSVINYEGYIYGIEVERNHTICVRRRGKIVFTGNSKRDYGDETITEWNDGWKGQLGLEPNPFMFVDHLIEIFREVKRVLKPTGNVFVVIDDTYARGGGWKSGGGLKYKDSEWERKWVKTISVPEPPTASFKGAPRKSLCLVPELFAIRMVYDLGFILRNKIIWVKKVHIYKERTTFGNAMPEPAKDRLAHSWEYVYHFVKKPKYWYNLDAVRVPHKDSIEEYIRKHPKSPNNKTLKESGKGLIKYSSMEHILRRFALGANPGDVLQVNPEPFPEAHFAVYPTRLVEFLIKVGCPKYVCKKCKKPFKTVYDEVEVKVNWKYYGANERGEYYGQGIKDYTKAKAQNPSDVKRGILKRLNKGRVFKGYKSACECDAGFEPGIVLDPFFGSGTTGLVTLKTGRNFLGIELNKEYCELALKRIKPLLMERLDKFISF